MAKKNDGRLATMGTVSVGKNTVSIGVQFDRTDDLDPNAADKFMVDTRADVHLVLEEDPEGLLGDGDGELPVFEGPASLHSIRVNAATIAGQLSFGRDRTSQEHLGPFAKKKAVVTITPTGTISATTAKGPEGGEVGS